jgi:type II secretory pathway pseudopilin PulG
VGRADRLASPTRRTGLTLVELLLAVGLLGVIASISFFCYNAAVRAWRAGTELSNSLHQGDFVIEQVILGLRSSYPSGKGVFVLKDDGEGETARDSIQWVKLGSALIGSDSPYAGMPHAVEVSVRDVPDARGKSHNGLAVRSWRLDLQKEDFDPETVPPVLLSSRVVGFNCRALDPVQNPTSTIDSKPDLKWLDEWVGNLTNSLPKAVEITLYVQPPEKGKGVLEMKRIVRLPMAKDY